LRRLSETSSRLSTTGTSSTDIFTSLDSPIHVEFSSMLMASLRSLETRLKSSSCSWKCSPFTAS